MFLNANKTSKTAPAVQLKTAGNSFFKKAGEDQFFGAKENPSFFGKPVQAKLTVSHPDDPHEKEADAVADKVMRMEAPAMAQPQVQEETLHRKEEEEVHAKLQAPAINCIACKGEANDNLQAKLSAVAPGGNNHYHKNIPLKEAAVLRQGERGPPAGTASFEQTLSTSKGRGSPLPGDTKAFMESRFGADFSGVRIHTGNEAQQLSSSINAQAFAHGNDIYFNAGKYSPASSRGGTLLAHELTHTIQQGASKKINRHQNTSKFSNLKNTSSLPGTENKIHSKEDDNCCAKKDTQAAVKIKATEVLNAAPAAMQNSTVAKPAAIAPAISRATAEEKLQQKEDIHEDKDSSPPGPAFLIHKKANAKQIFPAICTCSHCSGLSAKPLTTGAGTAAVGPKEISPAILAASSLQRERGPPYENYRADESEAAIQYETNQANGLVQRDAEGTGDAPKEESLLDKLKNGFDATLKLLLPTAIYTFYTKIKNGGILNFIKDSLASLFKGLFGKLGFSESEIKIIFQVFATLKSQLPAIIEGLSKGDCKPLFAALNLLSEVVSAIAGRVWDNLMAELEPVRLWLIDIWNTFGAPVIEEIKAFAGEKWEELKALGKFIWDSFKPIRDKGQEAWDWVVKKLGFGDSDEPGLLGYISGKLTEAWNSIKAELKPVIAPINEVVEGIKALASLGSVKQLQEDAKKWLDEVVKTATAMGSDEDAVASKQVTLRQVLLPALNKSIDRLKAVLKTAAGWVVDKVNFVAGNVTSFISGLQGNKYLAPMYPLIKWMPAAIEKFKDWATDKVTIVFDKLQASAEHLKKFIGPLLTLLEKLVGIAGNLLKNLPDLILGVPFMFMPRCIKDPIIKWLTEVVLKQIPIISEFISFTEKWEDIKKAALTVLKQVFVDGQLGKGLWTFFKTLLGILGIDPKLVTKVVAKAAQNFSDIIAKPGAFLKNIWSVIKGGFSLFWDNIWKHLPKGALDWLFGEVRGATQVAGPKDFSVGSILGFVMGLFGITKENVYKRMSENPRIGPEKVKRIREIESALTGALEWITVWIKEGAEGLLKKIKTQIGDVKDMVIQGVVSWITTKIVAEVTKKLATSTDPLGIGATINIIKQIYDAIKAAVAYVNRILNLVNDAMDNMAEIIAGNTVAASTKFEAILAKAVPVVIGFAVEAVLGPVGVKIKEIVDKVRKKIDDGIDWLINGALNFIGGIIDTGKKVIGAIGGWLGISKSFTDAKKDPHTLYFNKSGTLMIASEPMDVTRYLNNQASANAGNPSMLQTVQNAQQCVQRIDMMKKEIQFKQNMEGNEDAKASKYRMLDAEITKLASLLTILGGTLRPSGKTSNPLDAIPITWHKPLRLYPQAISINNKAYSLFEREKLAVPDVANLNNVRSSSSVASNEILIGVSPSSANVPVIGKVWPRVAAGNLRGGVKQEQFRELLRVSGFVWGSMEADHIRDLQWGGQDSYDNLWPLEKSHNNAANQVLSQDVDYEDSGKNLVTTSLRNTPLNLYFRIKDFT